MLVLYSLLRMLLRVATACLRGRVAAVERRYAIVALKADKLARESQIKPGNAEKTDPALLAKRTLQLGRYAEQRDQLEELHDRWTHRYESIANLGRALSHWNGKTVPYLLGIVDLVVVLALLQGLGLAPLSQLQPLLDALVRMTQP